MQLPFFLRLKKPILKSVGKAVAFAKPLDGKPTTS